METVREDDNGNNINKHIQGISGNETITGGFKESSSGGNCLFQFNIYIYNTPQPFIKATEIKDLSLAKNDNHVIFIGLDGDPFENGAKEYH